MLREGTMPEGYTVKKRRLVISGDVATKSSRKSKGGKKRKDSKVQPIAA
jgi:hypothetical protein